MSSLSRRPLVAQRPCEATVWAHGLWLGRARATSVRDSRGGRRSLLPWGGRACAGWGPACGPEAPQD